MFDAVIVGGSLAGAATGIHLARRGHRVVILERAREVRRKACGEGLFPRGVQELRSLGVGPSSGALGAPIEGVRFHAGRYAAAARFGEGPALGVRRTVLDPLLRERAQEAGVELRTGVSVRTLSRDHSGWAGAETEDGELVAARVVVGADGLRSRVRRAAGLERSTRGHRYGVSAHLALPHGTEPFVDVHFDDDAEVYVTPVGDGEANVAVLLRRAGMQRFAGRLTEGFRSLLLGHPELAGAELLDAPIAAGPFPAACRKPWRDNLVLVGDAAGFVDAISGEGMSTSLVAARYCADAVSAHLEGDAGAFERYADQRRQLVRNADLLARLSLALSSTPALARHSVRNLERQPATFERLVGISAGDRQLRDLRPRDLLALTLGL